MSDSTASSRFVTTRWSQVHLAHGDDPEARRALSELCENYYQPVLRFLEHQGRSPDAARDCAHQFFAHVLSNRCKLDARPELGRFRSYLLGTLKHFLADQRDHTLRLKRGGGVRHESIDQAHSATDTSPGLEIPMPVDPAMDLHFDRQWAMTLMDQAMTRLQDEYVHDGRGVHFESLKVWLLGEIPSISQLDSGRALGLSEGAVKVSIHRLRKRFRELIRLEISQTLGPLENVEAELRYLVDVLARS